MIELNQVCQSRTACTTSVPVFTTSTSAGLCVAQGMLWLAAMCISRSCQPLLGVNLSPEFVNLYFPYAGQGLLFFAGGSSILNCSQHLWQWKEEAVVYEIHMRDFRFHFQQDFLAYCTRPVSVHLAMASVGCSFNSFSVFLFSLKQQNLMKIVFSYIHFPILPYPPKRMKKLYSILVNCMGWQVWWTVRSHTHTGAHMCTHTHTPKKEASKHGTRKQHNKTAQTRALYKHPTSHLLPLNCGLSVAL